MSLGHDQGATLLHVARTGEWPTGYPAAKRRRLQAAGYIERLRPPELSPKGVGAVEGMLLERRRRYRKPTDPTVAS